MVVEVKLAGTYAVSPELYEQDIQDQAVIKFIIHQGHDRLMAYIFPEKDTHVGVVLATGTPVSFVGAGVYSLYGKNIAYDSGTCRKNALLQRDRPADANEAARILEEVRQSLIAFFSSGKS